MSLRLVEIALPTGDSERLGKLLEDTPSLARFSRPADEDLSVTTVVVEAEHTERLLDALEERFSASASFRAVVLDVAAVVPKPAPEPEPVPNPEEAERARFRVSRDELLESVTGIAEVTPVFVALCVLSTIVACIGLRHGSPAVVIGAMVIAPLLGPNVAFALATTLWDRSLLRLAALANTVGAGIAFGISFAIGLALGAESTGPEIAMRTQVGLGDVVLALASGAAGVLSFTSAAPASLIGVMVAVALLPPLATFGMLLGSGHLAPAFGALLLLVANVVGVNLAGVVTFYIQGIRPRRWWEARRAVRAARWAFVFWIALLSAVLASIVLRSRA